MPMACEDLGIAPAGLGQAVALGCAMRTVLLTGWRVSELGQ